MTTEAQRIAIAEACGWTAIENCGGAGGFIAKMPDGQILWDDCLGATQVDAIDANCPDYLNDLNAMHEARKVFNTLAPLRRDQWWGRYIGHLCNVCNCDLPWMPYNETVAWEAMLSSTAEQQAEAFLRTIGKWEDGK